MELQHVDPDNPGVDEPVKVFPDCGTPKPICIPLNVRTRHVHLIGRPGMGRALRLWPGLLNAPRRPRSASSAGTRRGSCE